MSKSKRLKKLRAKIRKKEAKRKKTKQYKYKIWTIKNRDKLNKSSKCEVILSKRLKELHIFHGRNILVKTGHYKCRYLDILIDSAKLIVEVDGTEHDQSKDKKREKEILSKKRYESHTFMRFTNKMVYDDLDSVVLQIYEYISKHAKASVVQDIKISPSCYEFKPKTILRKIAS